MNKPIVLTMNAGDSIKVETPPTVNKKWHNQTGTIVSVHPISGCYRVIIANTEIVLFEHEMELTNG